jgi:membrane protease YdiL (CAAX protease family)
MWQLAFGVVACVLLALGVWYFRPGVRRRLLQPQRQRAVPWSAFEVFFAWVLITILWPLALQGFLFSHDELDRLRGFLRLQALTFPLPALALLVLLRILSGTRPYQVGLTTHRLFWNVLAGLLAWVCLTPFVYVVLDLVNWLTSRLFHVAPEEHPLTRLSQAGLSTGDWILLVISAVVVAPVLEELVFRGVVQPWLARRPWGGGAALFFALLVTLGYRYQGLEAAMHAHNVPDLGRELAPVLFIFALVPGLLFLEVRTGSTVPGAIYGTSLFWAMMHANIWPTPVPLFVLGLALGYLAYRTQSLVAPLVLHALFNGVACVLLAYPQTVPPPAPTPTPKNGSETTAAVRRPAADSTSTAVPGSWLPRRRYASAIGPSRGDTTDDATCPTSSPPRSTLAPGGTGPSPGTVTPSSVRLTWPRSRAMTIGSWPR